MTTNNSLRYPGVRPFETHEQHLFFGRSRDIEELYDLILLERLVVLFAKSGYGKSSLIKAGLIPRFIDSSAPENRQYLPVQVRFGTYVAGKSASPLEAVVNALDAVPVNKDAGFLEGLTTETRLWHRFKMRGTGDGTARFLLVFDQFEELFSYPEEQQAQFRAEIAELVYEEIPQDVRLAARSCTREQRAFLAQPMDAKVLFAIRADRLSLLDSMKDRLPAILHKRYELRALDAKQAREAIVMPAALPPELLGEGACQPFRYSADALEKMLRELSGTDAANKGRIEAFQLQIVCASIEKRVNDQGLQTISAADLPDFSTVYEDYYNNRISELPPEEQEQARRVLEDGLMLVDAQSGDARRLSRDAEELALSMGISTDLLKNLERTYLVRRTLNSLGGYSYEISHDTLLAPMLRSRRQREAALEQLRMEQERLDAERRAREAEEKAREEAARRAEAERLQLAAEKAKKRASRFAVGVGLLAVLAAIAFFWANRQSRIAREQRDLAQIAERAADSSAQVAVQKQLLADSSALVAHRQEMRADSQKTIAETNAETARLALIRMLRANENLVDQALLESTEDIRALKYETALVKLSNAALLGRKQPQVAHALLEMAYVYAETGQLPDARKAAGQVATLLGKHTNLDESSDRNQIRNSLRQLASSRFTELEARYYPVMLPVKGRGDQSGFELAKSETTVWQYNLYLRANGKDMLDAGAMEGRPGWGWEGNNPVVFVSWYDAVLYANWLSTQRGLTPVYDIDQVQQDTNNINDSDIDPLKWTVTKRAGSNGYRLPTDSEWMYAARGGANPSAFACAGSDEADEVAWYRSNSGNRTHAVAAGKKANSLGLYDMSGNVFEWCWDWVPESFGRYRVVHGGSWKSMASTVKIETVGTRYPSSRGDQYGFRLAR
ncbi:MAG: hypothetical protein EP344_17470 [Bacteroidetes bacterium]|nr:MAG: hypothetical protein EP344_17470 [Bacteroidota bacterium]